ncbi:MAG TPA: serine hydrolase domain-containing protein, partial [Candidatus Eremiobacteraceae bacterium]|nr:serine hydrolase domain-containing protein [Candidatus Eremiobacteraceae bacterium]
MIAAMAAIALTAAQRSAIDSLAKSAMVRDRIAGISLVVRRGGAVVYENGFGYADIAHKIRATPATIYPIGSVTKQFTAACVMLLAQGGKLSTDDALSAYVAGLPWANRVTLRHLLDQESGIVDFRLGALDYTTPLTSADLLARLAPTDLLFAPGSRYEYSNSNYYLLGLVVEKAAGTAYAQYLHDRILGPLDLTSTSYGAPSNGSRVARGYAATAGGPQP